MGESSTVDRVKEQARVADELHERSRTLLVDAVRSGAAAGLSQREIAAAVGRSQPEVSRLLRFQASSELGRILMRNRSSITTTASKYGVKNIRVFGSVARGTDTLGSDIDLLVDLAPGTSLFTLARLERELSELLDAEVDVVPACNLRKNFAGKILSEAVPL